LKEGTVEIGNEIQSRAERAQAKRGWEPPDAQAVEKKKKSPKA